MQRVAPIALGALLACGLAQAQQPDEARAKKIVGGSCFLCHGMEGESASEVFPRLAGQNAGYIVSALKAYKAGTRKHDTMHANAVNLSDEDMADIAAFMSSYGK